DVLAMDRVIDMDLLYVVHGQLLHCDRERAVDHEIGTRDAARHRARDEHDAVRHLLGGTELARRINLERRGKEIGHVLFDILPDSAVEIGVARRHAIHAYALAHQLATQAFGIVDQCRLDGAVRAGGEVDLETRDAGYQRNRWTLRLLE